MIRWEPLELLNPFNCWNCRCCSSTRGGSALCSCCLLSSICCWSNRLCCRSTIRCMLNFLRFSLLSQAYVFVCSVPGVVDEKRHFCNAAVPYWKLFHSYVYIGVYTSKPPNFPVHRLLKPFEGYFSQIETFSHWLVKYFAKVSESFIKFKVLV